MSGMTNSEFAKQNEVFIKACELAGVTITSRQASKFRRKQGLAYKKRQMAITELNRKKKEEV